MTSLLLMTLILVGFAMLLEAASRGDTKNILGSVFWILTALLLVSI